MAIDIVSNMRNIASTAAKAGAAAAGGGPGATGIGSALGSSSSGAATIGGSDLGSTFSALLDNVEQRASEANVAVSNMVNKTGDVHDAMIALQRSEMALELTVQIRNKFVQAYQDIMRMPI